MKNILLAGLVLATASVVHAASLAEFNFNGNTTNTATSDATPGNVVDAVTLSNANGADPNLRSVIAQYAATQTTLAGAISANDYFTFTITPATGTAAVDLSSITFFAFSENGVATFSLTNAAGTVFSSTNIASVNPDAQNSYTLNFGTAGTTITGPTEFRVYDYGNTGSGYDSQGFGSQSSPADTGVEFEINGTGVAAGVPTPEPGTYALMGLGVVLLAVTMRKRRSFAV